MKTNKSFAKRIKVTKNGKLTTRRPGQNHFNAKESRRAQMAKSRTAPLTMNNKNRSLFLPNY
ncbi:MAG: bL35 family ribosomal protein [Candidatus Paceibacterota bacterium]|jgi:ribosomal protein L35